MQGRADTAVQLHLGLSLEAAAAEANLQALQAAGITHVVQVLEKFQPSHPTSFTYLHVPLPDDPMEDLVAHFAACLPFMNQAISQGGAVLVQCRQGISRSAAVATGYLMWKLGLGYDDAFQIIIAARPQAAPNAGFREQLREFERLGCDPAKWQGWKPARGWQFQLQAARQREPGPGPRERTGKG